MARLLKYKGNHYENQVWINAFDSKFHTVKDKLESLFGKLPDTLPNGCLVVHFFLNPGKPSLISCNDENVNFTYNIQKLKLLISVKQKITRGIDLYSVNIPQSNLPNKVLIKEILEVLVK